tara:strand:+ start:469 stop:663 length:195 start_codon:yes stop_codon:yes gene_type:complete
MWIVKTSVDPNEGIVGLNGYFYLLEEDDTVMKFSTKEDARNFIENAGENPDDEYLDYVNLDDKD